MSDVSMNNSESKSILIRLIKDRVNLFGDKYKLIAEKIGVHPVQLSKFMKEENEGPLDREALEKLMRYLGIELECYENRYKLAADVATILHEKKLSVDYLSKEQLISLTEKKEIKYLLEFESKEEMEEFLEHNIIERESTFYYFKSLVSLFEKIIEKGDIEDIRSSVTRNILNKESEKSNGFNIDKLGFVLGTTAGIATLLGGALMFLSKDKK